MTKRAYDNARREQKSRETRDAILAAMVDRLADGADDIVVAEVARSAGVAVRTVYQHFPDKAARVHAIHQWIDERVDTNTVMPSGWDDIPDYVERLVAYIFRNESLVRAQLAPGLAKSVRTLRKQVHIRHLRKALRERLTQRSIVDEVTALVICLVRVEAIFDLRDLYGMSETRIKAKMRRLIELQLSDSLRTDPGGSGA